MAAGAVFTGTTKLDTSGMREGFARLRAMTAKAAKDMNQTMNGAGRRGTSEPLSGWDKAIDSTRNSFARMQSAWANASKAMQYYSTRIKKDVLVPLTQATQAAERFAKRAAIAGAALAGFGVYRNFKIEGMEQQFATLMGDSEKARKTIRNLLDEAAKTPFSADNYAAAYKTLLTTANGELATGDNMRRIGDAAAVMGKQIEEVAGQVSYLYAMLKAGKGGGVAARQMLKDSIITLDTYKLIDKESKNAANFGAVWSRVVADLNNFSGGMERVSRTGSGALKVLRNLADTALQETFAALADSIKDVVFNLAEMLRAARASGQLAEIGKKIGEVFRDIVDGIYRAIQAFRQMDETSRAALNNILAGMAAVAGLQYTGILGPLLKAIMGASGIIMSLITRISLFALGNIALITQAIAGIGTALVGFNLGNAIYESIGDTGKKVLEIIATILEGIVTFLWNAVRTVFVPIGKAIWEALANPRDFSFDKMGTVWKENFLREAQNWMQGIGNTIDQSIAAWKSPSAPAKSFGDAWMSLPEKVGGVIGEIAGKIQNLDMEDLLKIPGMEGLAKWVAEFKKLEGIKLPELPKPPDMTAAKQNAEAIAEANRKANAYTIRGYYFRKLDMAAIIASAKNNGKIAEHNRKRELEAKKKEQSKQTLKPIETEFQKSNRLLEEIKRNTGKNSGAVYA